MEKVQLDTMTIRRLLRSYDDLTCPAVPQPAPDVSSYGDIAVYLVNSTIALTQWSSRQIRYHTDGPIQL